jgi:hypothetical protein
MDVMVDEVFNKGRGNYVFKIGSHNLTASSTSWPEGPARNASFTATK